MAALDRSAPLAVGSGVTCVQQIRGGERVTIHVGDYDLIFAVLKESRTKLLGVGPGAGHNG